MAACIGGTEITATVAKHYLTTMTMNYSHGICMFSGIKWRPTARGAYICSKEKEYSTTE